MLYIYFIISRFQYKLEFDDGETTVLDKCFNFNGGNSGLTEDFSYNNQPSTEDEKIPILSSATSKLNEMGYISKNAKPKNKKLKIFNKECVLIARNGYAGTMTYLNNYEFTINDHAYVLTPKKEWKNKINLRWFVYQYQELFYNMVTSKSDNATFNKTYAEKQKIILPDKEFQDGIVEKLFKIDCLIEELDKANKQIEKLLFCEIIS
ncbi:MAG: restriction endonuclease subunit S [Candidatus Methanoperedens sp.]|nr:restriction endonuclease subunit S [Candidatus Methanoperedens sp.]